jgi:beta-lactamase superfamily II metal-dependent hydrolase
MPRMSITRLLLVAGLVVSLAARSALAQTLDIYFIDVEGGQSTLVVSPSGESLLVDTGYAGNEGRDPNRVLAAAKTAGIRKIDYLLITHFHGDHVGGAPEVAKQIPIGTFVDHGAPPANPDPRVVESFRAYAAVRASGRHIHAKPGDRIPMKGLDVQVVSSATAVLTTPIAGGGHANPLCEPAERPPAEPLENPQSTGIHLRFGRFRFLDLGDLTGTPLYALFCPANRLGQIDLLLVPHHGGADVASPALFAVQPRVAIMNNGATKGGSAEAFEALHQALASRGLQDVWQVDKSANAGVRNFADDRIANLDERTGHWIKVSAAEDGSFTVTNGRTGESKAYRPQ